MNIDARVVYGIIGVVCVAWLTVTIISALRPTVEVPPALNSVFLAIAGAAVAKLGSDKARSHKNDNDNSGGDTE